MAFFDGQRQLRVRNIGSEEIPPWAVLRITDYDLTNDAVNVDKPDSDSMPPAQLLFNLGSPIPEAGYGAATAHTPALVLYNEADDPPEIGEECGTEADSWKLHSAQTGMIAWGGHNDEADEGVPRRAIFVAAGGGAINCSCPSLPSGWTDAGTACYVDFAERDCDASGNKLKRTQRICLTSSGFQVHTSPWVADTDPAPAIP